MPASGYKTFIFNAILGITGLVKLVAPDAELPDEEAVNLFANNAEALILVGIGIVGMILRAVTNSPIFKKGE